MRHLGLVALLLGFAACGPGAHAGLGVSMSSGSALVPTSVEGGTVTSISYREQGGIMTRTLLQIMTAFAFAPATNSVTSMSSGVRCSSGACYTVTTTTTTTTTTTILDSPEQLASKAAKANAMLEAIGTSEIPMTFELDIASRSLGGDSSGWMSTWMWQGAPTSIGAGLLSMARLSGGIGAGKLKFYQREQTTLSEQGMGIEANTQVVDSVGYSYFGVPLRLDLALGASGLFARTQLDLNLMSFIDSVYDGEDAPERLSPTHVGLGYSRGPIRVLGNLTLSRFRSNALSAGLELAIVL